MPQDQKCCIVVQIRGIPQFREVLSAAEELLDMIENTYPSINDAPQVEAMRESLRELEVGE